MWRYREALPVEAEKHIVSFGEGFTPLISEDFFGKPVFLKLDYVFPSGSFKDRGASVLVSKIKELTIENVVEDSSGNAGAAIAMYCAKANVACDIYVPETTSAGKLEQIQHAGATLHKIPGSREDTTQAVWDVVQTTYYASHYWNPFFFQGTKTCAFEIVEQLGWRAPDAIITPVGNGTLLFGLFLGLQELLHESIIQKIPKIIGVQAANCSPLVDLWNHRTPKQRKKTIAEGIAIARPVRAPDIIHAVQETKGSLLSVTEHEITQALRETRRKGYYIEPTSAVAVAGISKFKQNKNDVVVVPLTGHGLKTQH